MDFHFNCIKTSYENRKDARAARSVLEIKHSKKFKIYRCLHCGAFHLTTKKDGKEKGRVDQRVVVDYQYTCSLRDQIDGLVRSERRKLSRVSKASKAHRKHFIQDRHQANVETRTASNIKG
jgi:hypothetical protein